MAKTFNIKCFELAEHFTSDAPDEFSKEELQDLACEIQQVVEDWFACRPKRPDA